MRPPEGHRCGTHQPNIKLNFLVFFSCFGGTKTLKGDGPNPSGRLRADMGKNKSKKQQLLELIESLPLEQVNRLALTVELKKLKGEESFFEKAVLETVRPILAKSLDAPMRLFHPQRLFCIPFEDLLYEGDVSEKEFGRIARSSILPIWNWLAEDLIPDDFARLEREARQRLLDGDRKAADEHVAELRRLSSAAIFSVLVNCEDDPESYRTHCRRLGGERVLEDARDIAAVFKIAPQILDMQAALPQAILKLAKPDVDAVMAAYNEVRAKAPEFAPILFLVVMGRLQTPWSVLKLIRLVAQAQAEDLFSDMPVGIPGRLLLNDARKLASYFDSITEDKMRPHDALQNLSYFVQLYEGIYDYSGLASESEAGKRLEDYRDRIIIGIERLLDRAITTLRNALPFFLSGDTGGTASARPDISDWPDSHDVDSAIDHIIMLDGSKTLADRLELSELRDDTLATIQSLVRHYAEKIADEMHAAEGNDLERARAHAETAVLLTRHVFGEQEAAKVIAMIGEGVEA